MQLVGSITADKYHAVGTEFVRYFTEYGLSPDASVLDIGCGSGRIAIALTEFLSPGANYQGFDIVPSAIEWCQREISSRYNNFEFYVADVRNRFYNPNGPVTGSQYRFPHDDSTFDFVFLTSVFTHLLPADLENYLAEIARVLKPGGRCLATFFLANDESLEHLATGRSDIAFDYSFDHHRVMNPEVPEFAVCYDEPYVTKLLANNGLSVLGPVRYGSWCGRKQFTSYQDFIVMERQ
ncbi:class I SAM-dependent methyltransferase [Skermania sp. ID1734]|nr:class I SAM-dependent methyltransferase [Skermania sp. ID1734]